jgi:hypothetical protein
MVGGFGETGGHLEGLFVEEGGQMVSKTVLGLHQHESS